MEMFKCWVKNVSYIDNNRDYHIEVCIQYVDVHQKCPISIYTKLEGPSIAHGIEFDEFQGPLEIQCDNSYPCVKQPYGRWT